MDGKTSDWRPGPSVCRCCLAEGCYKDISTEYFWMGKREVYAEMLSDTFSVSIAYSSAGGPNSHSRLICEPCISRLRDAADFKRQVQECERTFMQHLDPGGTSAVSDIGIELEPIGKEVKLEQVKLEKRFSDDDFDNIGFGDDDDDDMDDQPLTKFASKVPKKETVDFMDLIDNSQVSVKRMSTSKSKAPPSKKIKLTKKAQSKPAASKAPIKVVKEKKKKDSKTEERQRQGALTSIWELTLSERQNASELLENTTARPFVYCRYFFKCFFCQEQYSDLNILLQHTLTHNIPEKNKILKEFLPKGKRTVKVDVSELKCRICQQHFGDLDEIRTHLSKEHDKQFTKSGHGLIAYNLKSVDGQFSCHVCSKIFQTFILLNRHMNVHFSNAVCETCGAGFMTHQRLLQHKEIHLPGGYPCDKCPKVYTTNSNLKFHKEKAHEGVMKARMLRCPHCTERFAEHFRKLKHLKDAHGITFTYECDVCKTMFTSRRALTMHTNKFHTVKTRCQVCQKSFSCVTTLKKHMISHTGERSHVCALCKKSYRHKKSLKQHMRAHVNGNHCIKFSCSDCGNGFPTRNDFNKHVKEWHPRSYFDYPVNGT